MWPYMTPHMAALPPCTYYPDHRGALLAVVAGHIVGSYAMPGHIVPLYVTLGGRHVSGP